MSVGAQMVIVLKAFVEHCVALILGHPFEFSWREVSQTDVFHRLSPIMGGQRRNLARWFVQPIVAGHRENRQQGRFFYCSSLSRPARNRRSGSNRTRASAFSYESRA